MGNGSKVTWVAVIDTIKVGEVVFDGPTAHERILWRMKALDMGGHRGIQLPLTLRREGLRRNGWNAMMACAVNVVILPSIRSHHHVAKGL